MLKKTYILLISTFFLMSLFTYTFASGQPEGKPQPASGSEHQGVKQELLNWQVTVKASQKVSGTIPAYEFEAIHTSGSTVKNVKLQVEGTMVSTDEVKANEGLGLSLAQNQGNNKLYHVEISWSDNNQDYKKSMVVSAEELANRK